jgi:hypothetical protein
MDPFVPFAGRTVKPAPVQTVVVKVLVVIFGTGFTVIVNVLVCPIQVPNTGVTPILEVIGVRPGFAAVNDGILPVPVAARPMAVLLLVQVNTPTPVIAVTDDVAPLQYVLSEITST